MPPSFPLCRVRCCVVMWSALELAVRWSGVRSWCADPKRVQWVLLAFLKLVASTVSLSSVSSLGVGVCSLSPSLISLISPSLSLSLSLSQLAALLDTASTTMEIMGRMVEAVSFNTHTHTH